MRLKLSRCDLYPDTMYMHPEGTSTGFIVDRKLVPRLRVIRWRFIDEKKRARGYFGREKTRLYLHRYVVELSGKHYPEVTFANGDWFDCRMVNLKPYRREEEGATRRIFRNNTSQRKGVCFKNGKWCAMIRHKGKLRNLGTYTDPDAAAHAYSIAWKLAHPTL